MNIIRFTRLGSIYPSINRTTKLISKLEQVNQRDAAIVFSEKLQRIEKEISPEVAGCVTTSELATDILRIHTFYGKNTNDTSSMEDIVRMRSYMKSVLSYYNDIPEPVLQYIETLLKNNKALN